MKNMKRVYIFCLTGIMALMAERLPAQNNFPGPGDLLPALSLNFLGEQPELRGKPLLIEFWATWCPPCRKSIPHLNQIYSKFRDKGLQIVGITDEDEGTVKKFESQIPITYNVAIDTPKSLYDQFGIEGIPTAFLVDRDGKIVWTGHPLELTETQIQSVLN